MMPSFRWLPRAYAAADAPVAALFAVMTKVGVYAILRVYTLIFGTHAGPLADLALAWLWPLALATLVLGAVGALAARELRGLVAYAIIVSVGTLLAGIALATPQALAAALYYLLHTTLLSGGLFLLADLIRAQRGVHGDDLQAVAAPVAQPVLLGSLFFVGAMAAIGMPPLSGFIGKLLLLAAAVPEPAFTTAAAWLWSAILVSSLILLIALSRAGSRLFWRTQPEPAVAGHADPVAATAVMLLLGTTLLLSVLAAPVTAYVRDTAQQLLEPDAYIAAVLAPKPRLEDVP